MKQSGLNIREHIKPLVIADTVFTIGIALLVLVWIFGDEPGFMGGFIHNEESILLGLGIGLSIGGGMLMLGAIRRIIRARKQFN